MKKKIYLCDLLCYQNATDGQIQKEKVSSKSCFDLSQLPNKQLQEEAELFILERGNRLALSSIKREIVVFNMLCKFINEKEPNLMSFNEKSFEVLVRKLKAWLLTNGYFISYSAYDNAYAKQTSTMY